MSALAVLFLIASSIAVIALPRRWAPLPLLMGACYMTAAQSFNIGPFHFTVLRVLILLAALRAFIKGERLPGGLKGLDWVLIAWGVWLILSSFFHAPFTEALVFRLGAVYNALGVYFIIRIFLQRTDDLVQLVGVTAFLLIPVAIEMLQERATAHNLFSSFGGVPSSVMVRDGKLRAQGPFGHPILAGTVGALCIPLMVGIWKQRPTAAKIGLTACLMMVIASNSSGPLMSVMLSLIGISLWPWRHLTRTMRWAMVAGYMLLEIVMKDPAYYILARIDLTGSSTGYHRARLIQSSYEHLKEWWFAGTDYTRDWMPYGVSWNQNHCDITNQYLYYGVWGGLLLMFLFIIALALAFRYVGQALRASATKPFRDRFMIWSLGSALFAHAATCISVAYFDQSVMFLYLNLATICSLHAHRPEGPDTCHEDLLQSKNNLVEQDTIEITREPRS